MAFIDNVVNNLGGLFVAVGDETDEFSWGQCDSCDSRLGGSRHEASAYDRSTKEVIELRICSDCVMFHANGELPEGEED